MARINYVISRANVGGEIVEHVGEFQWDRYTYMYISHSFGRRASSRPWFRTRVITFEIDYKMYRIVWSVLCVKIYVSISSWMNTLSNFKNFDIYLNIWNFHDVKLRNYTNRRKIRILISVQCPSRKPETRHSFLNSVSKEDPRRKFLLFTIYVLVNKIHTIRWKMIYKLLLINFHNL